MNKGVAGLLILFFGFWMFTEPGSLAGAAESATTWAWDLTQQFFGSIIDFIGSF